MTHPHQITILVADDHPMIRAGIAALLAGHADVQLVAEAANGNEAVKQFLAYRPHVTLLDLRMPEMDGLSAAREILQLAPEARIILISTYEGDDDIGRALRAGVRRFLPKEHLRAQLLDVIRTVYRE